MVLGSTAEPSHDLARLAAELGLAEHLQNTEALKAELQKIVVALHPDKTGGEFKSDRDKARFMQARTAVKVLGAERLGEEPAGAMPLPGGPRALGDAALSRKWRDTTRHLQRRMLADARERVSCCFAGPRNGSAAAAAVMLLLAAIPDQFERHQLLGPLLATPGLEAFLLALGLVSGTASAVLWAWERSAHRRAEHLMSEAALAEILQQARRCAERNGRIGTLSAFDIRRGVDILTHGRGERVQARGGWGLARGLDLETLENISVLQTQRLLDRRVIRVCSTPSIEVLYEVS